MKYIGADYYRILSIDASKIKIGRSKNTYELPKEKNKRHKLFSNTIDYSLELIKLKSVFNTTCKKEDFTYEEDNGDELTLVLINLTFEYTIKDDDKNVKYNTKEIREILYDKGFDCAGRHYVRYKRSAGASRSGHCLFIDERLYETMDKWNRCGLTPDMQSKSFDVAAWESYISLPLSSLVGLIQIPLDSILFVDDVKIEFEDEVIDVSVENNALTSVRRKTKIINDIWDGESLLDESLFEGIYEDKHMLLLRNRFFKSCAFKTKLQQWFRDNQITLEDLKMIGVTTATDIDQILMVTTPNSLKYLKFTNSKKLNITNIKAWTSKVHDEFGVVKYDKRTRYFNGRYVKTSYQFLNTLGINEEDATALLQPSIDYLSLLRKDYDVLLHHFKEAYKKEGKAEETKVSLYSKADIAFMMMNINYDFKNTKIFKNFINDFVEDYKQTLMGGEILIKGTNATLFGNGPELLFYLAGQFDKDNPKSILKKGEVMCNRFKNGEELLCARSPHITMGNLYRAKNNTYGRVWRYFDLGDNIICVNSIDENLLQKLNGCDFDSDAMLVTNDKLCIDIADRHYSKFLVPVCSIPTLSISSSNLSGIDYATSVNKIGEIVNQSQILNSKLWDEFNNDNIDEAMNIYLDICKLSVLSGIEIDKAKRSYGNVNAVTELAKLEKRYKDVNRPTFFKTIDDNNKRNKKAKSKEYITYKTGMDYIHMIASDIDYRNGKEKKTDYINILDMLNEPSGKLSTTNRNHIHKAVDTINEYKKEISSLFLELKKEKNESNKVFIYRLIVETAKLREKEFNKVIKSELELYNLLKKFEESGETDWYRYEFILNSQYFKKLLKHSKRKLAKLYEYGKGEYKIFDIKYGIKYDEEIEIEEEITIEESLI